MTDLTALIASWWHALWRQWTHYDLGEGLAYDTHIAWRDLCDALLLALLRAVQATKQETEA